jgi:RNA polymerase sigma factor (sigma-70 family)
MGRQDVSALIASFRDNYRDLLRFLTRRTGDAERAADLAQDTYLKLAALGPASGEIRNPRAYVYRVAGNLAIDTLRRDGRIANDFTFHEAGDVVADPTPTAEARVIAQQRLRRREAALDELPTKPRLALLLNRVEGRTFAEIAGRLAVSESMVAKYIAQALRHCRDRLARDDNE